MYYETAILLWKIKKTSLKQKFDYHLILWIKAGFFAGNL